MKNVTITGIMASMLMTTGVAFAAGEADAFLTTKNYVDAGLRAVYQTASDAASDASTNASNIATNSAAIASNASSITTLQGTVGEHTTSIATNAENIAANASSITALQAAISGLDGAAYSGVNGVTISDHNVSLNVNATEGNMYVYTSSGWSELDVVDTWNSSVLADESGL